MLITVPARNFLRAGRRGGLSNRSIVIWTSKFNYFSVYKENHLILTEGKRWDSNREETLVSGEGRRESFI